MKKLLVGATLLTATVLSGCGGGGGGSTYGLYNSPYISATGFVNALNDVDGAPSYDESEIVLYTDETVRSSFAGQDDWFVIYDAKYDEYKAVSLQYIRSLYYYDYYSNNYATADEFRDIEDSDIANFYFDGDFGGDDYEVVDYRAADGFFYGRESGYAYEDETESTDVNLIAAEVEFKKLAKKAAKISFAYELPVETALSIASLGKKVEKMVVKGAASEELTQADQDVLLKDLQHLTGVTLEEVVASGNSEEGKQAIVKKIAEKNGTNADTVRNQLLPELFGVQL